MENQILDGDNAVSVKKEKNQRKESLLFKYGVIAFLEILAIVSVFPEFYACDIKITLAVS